MKLHHRRTRLREERHNKCLLRCRCWRAHHYDCRCRLGPLKAWTRLPAGYFSGGSLLAALLFPAMLLRKKVFALRALWRNR